MYSTCIHCHAALGANESVEHFPIGRRLAFDAAKGRLWVVCTRCRRWNLTPLEERWEAVEECERAFRGTKQRITSDNIGLAKVADVELVRIGKPLRPEMAAWRYGASLRRGLPLRTLPFVVGMTSIYAAQFTLSADALGGWLPFALMGVGFSGIAASVWNATRIRVMLPDGTLTRRQWWHKVSLVPDGASAWAIEGNEETRLTGTYATHSLRGLLTNGLRRGGRTGRITDALSLLEQVGAPERFPRLVAEQGQAIKQGELFHFPAEVRLALEMSIHEDEERLLADNELSALQSEWKLAEEVARIADSLPDSDPQP